LENRAANFSGLHASNALERANDQPGQKPFCTSTTLRVFAGFRNGSMAPLAA